MTSEYEDIYSRFLSRVTDYKLAELDEDIAKDMINGYMRQTVSKPYIRRLFSTFTLDNDYEEMEYELKFQTDEDSDKDFIEEVVATGMVIEWLQPKYKSVLNTAQFFGNSDQKWFSQANHMTELREMLDQAQTELRKLVRDRGTFNNSYLAE